MGSDFNRPHEHPTVNLPDHLDLIATTPAGIQKLRGLILELAVRGKLVPQDPNDEPASELLKRIAKERGRLAAEGSCKKAKATPLVRMDEQPCALPLSWAWTRLGEITNFGQTDKDGEIRDTTWVLDLEDIQKDTSVLLRKVRFAERQARSDKNRFHEGDVLYGKLRPYLNKVIVADEEGVCTTEILPVRGYYGVSPRYLMHAVKRPDFLAYVNSKSYGMKMPRLGADDGRLALFPLPPANEQHRIVAKVDELMALCDRLDAEQADAGAAHARLVATLLGTLTKSADAAELAANWQRLAEHFDTLFTTEASLDALKQTLLQLAVMGKLVPQDPNDEPASELLKRIAKERARLEATGKIKKSGPLPTIGQDTKPFDVPDGWEWLKLGTVVDLINGDRSKNYPNREEYVPAGVGWINTGHIRPDGTLATEGMHFITREKFDSLRSGKIEAHDLVYCLRGATFGKTAFVTPYSEGAIASSLVIVRPHLPTLKSYLFLYLTSPFGRSQIFQFDNGSAQPNLSANSVTLFAFPLPPLTEQHRIVAKVDELMALCDRLKAGLAESRAQQERLATTLIESALKAA